MMARTAQSRTMKSTEDILVIPSTCCEYQQSDKANKRTGASSTVRSAIMQDAEYDINQELYRSRLKDKHLHQRPLPVSGQT